MAAPAIPTHRKILYSAILVAVLLGFCETALRARQWIRYGSFATSVRDPMLVYDAAADLYVPKPGYELKGARINLKINSLGFRGDEFARQKPAQTVRVACLGASTTFCAEVSHNHKTWPHLLQDKLTAAYPGTRFEVINAAVGGFVAADNLKNLEHRVLPLDPDLVIYYEANNEIVRDTQELALRQGLIQTKERRPFVSVVSRYSLLFDLAYKNLAIAYGQKTTETRKMDAIPRDLPQHFIGLLDRMRTQLANKNIPMLLSTFSVKYRRHQPRATQIANADVAFYYMPWMSIDGLLDAMDTYNEAILEYGRSHGLPVVDDRNAIPPDAEHYSDCMHFVDKGAEAMADRFFRYLRESDVLAHVMGSARR